MNMQSVARDTRARAGLLLVICVMAGAALTALAPPERTLGDGIRVVYLHVAFTWAGLTGFVAMAALGVVVAITGRPALQAWAFAVGCVAALCFGIGAALSALASWVNWGGVYLAEPRMRANVTLVAVSAIALTLTAWPLPARLKGLLHVAPAAVYAALMPATPLVMHPANPIGASSSTAIRLTFAALYALCLGAAAGAALLLRRRLAHS